MHAQDDIDGHVQVVLEIDRARGDARTRFLRMRITNGSDFDGSSITASLSSETTFDHFNLKFPRIRSRNHQPVAQLLQRRDAASQSIDARQRNARDIQRSCIASFAEPSHSEDRGLEEEAFAIREFHLDQCGTHALWHGRLDLRADLRDITCERILRARETLRASAARTEEAKQEQEEGLTHTHPYGSRRQMLQLTVRSQDQERPLSCSK